MLSLVVVVIIDDRNLWQRNMGMSREKGWLIGKEKCSFIFSIKTNNKFSHKNLKSAIDSCQMTNMSYCIKCIHSDRA